MHPLSILRKAKGLSQHQLAVEIDVCQKSVWRWEKGKMRPSADSVRKLSEFFECDIKAIMRLRTR